MRILSKRQVKELVLYSPQHIARLEKAGLFPKRVQLGPNRVGWVEPPPVCRRLITSSHATISNALNCA
jgi:prophage regulatory protein